MRQGIIFGIVISVLSFYLVNIMFTSNLNENLDIVIMQNGEEIFSTPLLYSNEVENIWYIHEVDNEIKILTDNEIIEYYNFDLSVNELQNPDNIDYNKIYNVSGVDTEINMIQNTNGCVRVIFANCPDKIDVKMGEIRSTNKVITCAPHKLVIKLRNSNPNIEEEFDA